MLTYLQGINMYAYSLYFGIYMYNIMYTLNIANTFSLDELLANDVNVTFIDILL